MAFESLEISQNQTQSIGQRLIYLFLDLAQTIALSLAIFIVIYIYVLQPHQVKGESMYPTFQNADYILTEKMSFRFHTPKVGDVVVFRAPDKPDFDYIKRVIALPGDKVKLAKGHFYVNGELFDESAYLASTVVTSEENFLKEGAEILVPEDHYFLAGDNRPRSLDSRDFGPVPMKNIIGRSWLRYWPFSSISFVKHHN